MPMPRTAQSSQAALTSRAPWRKCYAGAAGRDPVPSTDVVRVLRGASSALTLRVVDSLRGALQASNRCRTPRRQPVGRQGRRPPRSLPWRSARALAAVVGGHGFLRGGRPASGPSPLSEASRFVRSPPGVIKSPLENGTQNGDAYRAAERPEERHRRSHHPEVWKFDGVLAGGGQHG